MTVPTLTLTDFLLARIAEDENAARDVHDRGCDVADPEGWCTCDRPARVLAECEAKRRIVQAARDLQVSIVPGIDRESRFAFAEFTVEAGDTFLRLLALPYANHPNYRDEWRP